MNHHQSNLPLVSIVIPAFNAADYLREAIDSVLDQSYPNIELIVLDDGSTDSSAEVLQSYPKGKFHWEGHPNMGQSATLNKGWSMACGEILGYLSADDALLEGAVKAAVAHLLEFPGSVMVYCDFEYMDQHSNMLKVIKLPDISYADMVLKNVCVPGPGAFWRRSAFEKAGGGWDPSLRQTPDYDFWLRLGLYGSFHHVKIPLARFRVHSGSQTCSVSNISKSEEMVVVIDNYFHRDDVPKCVQHHRSLAMANAHIFSASLHLRAGRFPAASWHVWEACKLAPESLLSVWSFKRLVGGLWLYVRR